MRKPWWMCKQRWTRFLRHLGEACHSFKYDIVVVEKDLQTYGEKVEASINEVAIQTYRNYPVGRGFKLSKVRAGIRSTTDGNSIYWLNMSNHRWICMEGDDLDLPRNKKGDIIGNVDAEPDYDTTPLHTARVQFYKQMEDEIND